ncbi:MAG: hypothetical protein ACYCXY_04645 [Acidimicrobiales bacterium]
MAVVGYPVRVRTGAGVGIGAPSSAQFDGSVGVHAQGRARPQRTGPATMATAVRPSSAGVRHLRLVGDVEPTTDRVVARTRPSRSILARLLPTLLTVGVLVGIWAGAAALRSVGVASLVAPPGARRVPGGYVVTVRPGQTVWSIASAMEPGADPRALVDRLDAELPGGVLVAGTVLRLP